jgi:hypothetical protein
MSKLQYQIIEKIPNLILRKPTKKGGGQYVRGRYKPVYKSRTDNRYAP